MKIKKGTWVDVSFRIKFSKDYGVDGGPINLPELFMTINDILTHSGQVDLYYISVAQPKEDPAEVPWWKDDNPKMPPVVVGGEEPLP